VDPAFGDCVDAFVIADLTRLLPKKKRRYLGEAWQHRPINTPSQEEQAAGPSRSQCRDEQLTHSCAERRLHGPSLT